MEKRTGIPELEWGFSAWRLYSVLDFRGEQPVEVGSGTLPAVVWCPVFVGSNNVLGEHRV